MRPDFIQPIQRALTATCTYDFLQRHTPDLGRWRKSVHPARLTSLNKFSKDAQKRLIEREMTLSELAEKLGWNRSSVSLVIHQRRRMPRVEAAVRKELDLEELAA